MTYTAKERMLSQGNEWDDSIDLEITEIDISEISIGKKISKRRENVLIFDDTSIYYGDALWMKITLEINDGSLTAEHIPIFSDLDLLR